MPGEMATFGRGEEVQGGSDQRTDVVKRPGARGPEERLQFGKRQLDRIEIRTVGWKKPELRPDGFDRGADRGLFMDHQVIEDDHIAGP